MQTFNLSFKNKVVILALGAESAGNFSVFHNDKIFFSDDFGDLLEEANWKKYQASVLKYLKDNKIKPKIILTDLHPLYKTTVWGKELVNKYNAKHIYIQHHLAHIFSTIGNIILHNTSYLLPSTFYGIAMDGTGFGIDEKIWGGEVFEVESRKNKVENVKRIGHLENQTMIGGDLAVREPARMLISILNKFLDKNKIYLLIKKYYNKNEFELIHNQLTQNFNCLETSSTGRILDTVSILLGFCENVRKYKHGPIDLLEKNSTIHYSDLKPKIIFDEKEKMYILRVIPLFKYLLKNIRKDKKLLATTAQLYIAEGLYKIINKRQDKRSGKKELFIAGGIANNKIISEYFISKGTYVNKKVPFGDAGLSFGQVVYYLKNN